MLFRSNNSLPTMDNLFRRQIVASNRCNIYKTHPEDILHVVWGCTKVANLWKSLTWAQHVDSSPLGDFTNLFSSFLQVRDNYGVDFFAITCWLLWNRRNAIRLDHSTRPLNQVFSAAGEMLHNFLEAQDEASTTPQVPVQAHWIALTQARYKL